MGLRYVTDGQPGFARKRRGKGFLFIDHEKNRITHDGTLERIRKLVIPPAWDSVWICRFANGHMQATGRDQRERKQYKYHSKWSEVRNESKFSKLLAFGHCLPSIRRKVEADLALNDLSRQNVLAAVVSTMERTMIRIGNDAYAEENDSYGLTTILDQHVQVRGSRASFRFRGKSGVLHETKIDDRRLSRLIQRCKDLPGQELFQYQDDDGVVHDVESGDVNAYLREISGENISAKDFRTWGGTTRAAQVLFELPFETDGEPTQKEFKKRHLHAIHATSCRLGNTVAVCRKYYVHPAILEADRDGSLLEAFRKSKRKSAGELDLAERGVLSLLKSYT
jgi:DNA topoisomerase-1